MADQVLVLSMTQCRQGDACIGIVKMFGSDKGAQAVYGLSARGCELRYGKQGNGKKTLAFPIRGETKESVAYPCRQYAQDFRGVYCGG